MNNVADHVHILFELHRTEALANVVMHVKKGTSRWLKEQSPDFAQFDWQEGYGVLPVRKDELVKVSHYIERQEEHHRRGNLSDLLERFEREEDDWPEGTRGKPPEGG